ncbi:Hypothetical predicted protein [Xyrichtys novacula]|uniref:Uncharacterized protein n=1 Tax=Xyrichtys novacula TaxID=13765 RepID=A0AAV1EPX7_XYRNO|nr:Hypothetical predicted protein [Xyrichtys novacula]
MRAVEKQAKWGEEETVMEEQMEGKGGEAVTQERRRQRPKQVVVKGQCVCDKACLDSMLTVSGQELVNTIAVHFTCYTALSRAHEHRSTRRLFKHHRVTQPRRDKLKPPE